MAKISTVKIFFDTNILHTKQPHLLLPSAIIDYIKGHRVIESVDINWYIPKLVIDERRHQMQIAAETLLPKLHELEKVIGHNLAINEDILRDRINDKINKEIEDNKINIATVDTSNVDLVELIERSVRRLPPFEISGEAEKGFRDAIIANTFFQEISASPTTPKVCRLVFVSGDARLREYIDEKTASFGNARTIESLDALKSLINAIASEVTEEFLSEITESAKRCFYDFDKKDKLYNKEGIFKKIRDQYEQELNSVTSDKPLAVRKDDGVTLGDQTFIDKTGQTVKWTREVILKFKIEHLDFGAFTNVLSGQTPPEEQMATVIAKGATRFLVHWQHQISTKGAISRPKVTKIEFIGHEYATA